MDENAVFVSISLDLAGSTPLKRAIFHAASNDFNKTNRLYDQYVHALFEIEETFYRFVSRSGVIDVRRLFLVKIIGDEYWYLYEVRPDDDADLPAIVRAFVHGLIDVMSTPRALRLNDDGREVTFDLSLKALVDLATNALNMSDRRYAFFADKISEILGGEARLTEVDDDDRRALCYGLNFRPAETSDASPLGIARSDYVGMQIDRFFRAARCCKPRLVTLGEVLWKHLDPAFERIEPGIDVYRYLDGGRGNPACLASHELIPALEMTGIDHDYEVWHLYSEATLRDDIYRPSHEVADFLAPTRAYLATTGFYGLRPDLTH